MALGSRKERVSVIYPGIDLERFSEANPAQERTARSIGPADRLLRAFFTLEG